MLIIYNIFYLKINSEQYEIGGRSAIKYPRYDCRIDDSYHSNSKQVIECYWKESEDATHNEVLTKLK